MLISWEAMDIFWYGQSFFKIKGKNTTVLIDPFNPEATGLKLPKDLSVDILLSSHQHEDHNYIPPAAADALIITGPGEYEKSGTSIVGIPSYHDDKGGTERGKNTIFHILIDGVSIVHTGDLGHLLTDQQTSLIDETDILMIPVGSVYTIDAEKAAEVVAQLEPKIIIPMHYKVEGLKYDLESLQPFLKGMGAETVTPLPKLTITKDKLPEQTILVVLEKNV